MFFQGSDESREVLFALEGSQGEIADWRAFEVDTGDGPRTGAGRCSGRGSVRWRVWRGFVEVDDV
jgi:hypothetical protein